MTLPVRVKSTVCATAVKNDDTWCWFQSQAEAIRAVKVIDDLVNPLSMTLIFCLGSNSSWMRCYDPTSSCRIYCV